MKLILKTKTDTICGNQVDIDHMVFETIEKILNERKNLADDLEKTSCAMQSILQSDDIYDILDDFAPNQGKMIRSLLFFKFLQFAPKHLEYEAAAILELLHFASLVHDDIVDANNKRRNMESFPSRHGYKKAVLLGDVMFIDMIERFLAIYGHDPTINLYFIQSCKSTAKGAILEQFLDENSGMDEYINVASLKTGSFMGLPCFLGGYLSGHPPEDLLSFGINFGILFQIQNDINCFLYDNFIESEDYMQNNITFVSIVLRDYFDYHIEREKSQQEYDNIKKIVLSESFLRIQMNIAGKYSNFCEIFMLNFHEKQSAINL